MIPGRPSASGDGVIYGSRQSERLVKEARAFDPQFNPPPHGNRDRAISLYQQAIEAQPGANVNAVLANRIAQLYGAFEDKERGMPLRPDKAVEWWTRCLKLTDPTQLLWSQAQMGLASSTVIQDDLESPASIYDKILAVDPNTIQLESWKHWARPDTAEAAAALQHELERKREEFRELQAKARQMKSYVQEQAERKRDILELRGEDSQSQSNRRTRNLTLALIALALAALLLLLWRVRRQPAVPPAAHG